MTKKNTALSNLRKAHQAQAITKDSYNMPDFIAKEGGLMKLVALETKYIEKFDAASPRAKADVHGNGMRTRFFLETGETIGTFSAAANEFFNFIANLMGLHVDQFGHVDIDGVIPVQVTKIPLEGGKSTYNFEILEDGGELNGFREYLPSVKDVLALPEGSADEETK